MTSPQISGRMTYSRALTAFDPDAIVACMSDDVRVLVAVHDQPLQGKDTAAFLFGVLTQELTPFRLVGEIVEGDQSVVLFQTTLRGQRADGLNVVTAGPDALVSELTVFCRPLTALQLIADVIGGHMAQRFGPPEGLR